MAHQHRPLLPIMSDIFSHERRRREDGGDGKGEIMGAVQVVEPIELYL